MNKLKIFISSIFVIIVIYFLTTIEYSEVIDVLKLSNVSFLIIGLIIFTINYLFKTLRLKGICSYYRSPISFKESLITQITSITLASFTPGRVGEFSKIYLLKKYKVKGAKTFAIPVLERLFDIFIISVFAMIFVLTLFKVEHFALLTGIILILLIFGIFFIINLRRFKFIIPKRFHHYVDDLGLNRFNFRLIAILFSTILIWLWDALGFFMILNGFHTDISYIVCIGIQASLAILSLLSILPGGLGSLDLSAFVIFDYFKVTSETTLAILFMVRIASFVIPLLMIASITPIIDFNIFKIRKEHP